MLISKGKDGRFPAMPSLQLTLIKTDMKFQKTAIHIAYRNMKYNPVK